MVTFIVHNFVYSMKP